ncbi:alpha/beta fold hydrolase [Chloroflexota bacterium]
MTEEYVTVNGLNTRYLVSGTGPVIILVHGLGEFLENWLFNLSALSKHFTVYAMDLPGHGLSDESKHGYTIGLNAEFVVNFMAKMGISHASIIGHSMGGPICLNLATDSPTKVDKLILVSTGGLSDKVPLSYRLATIPLLGSILLGPSLFVNKTTIRTGMKRQFYEPKSIPKEWVNAAYKHLKRPNRNKIMVNIIKNCTRLDSIRPEADITSKLPLVEQPTLIIHGLHDKVIPVEHAYKVSNLIPNVRLEIFDRCGHNPQVEKPSEFNELVLTFLRSNEHLIEHQNKG